MKLLELNNLNPTEESTFKKIVEEVAECNDAIEELVLFEKQELKSVSNWFLLSDKEFKKRKKEHKEKVQDVLTEIMDIAQTAASQMFVFEKKENISISEILKKNGYIIDDKNHAIFHEEKNFKYIYVNTKKDPETKLHEVLNRIISSMGKIAQLNKKRYNNGEKTPGFEQIEFMEYLEKYIIELFLILQYSFELLNVTKAKYNINMNYIFEKHVEKLKNKGYYTGEG